MATQQFTDQSVSRAFTKLAGILDDRHSLYLDDDNYEEEESTVFVGDILPILADETARLPRALAYCEHFGIDD